jgi:hypothetical protein
MQKDVPTTLTQNRTQIDTWIEEFGPQLNSPDPNIRMQAQFQLRLKIKANLFGPEWREKFKGVASQAVKTLSPAIAIGAAAASTAKGIFDAVTGRNKNKKPDSGKKQPYFKEKSPARRIGEFFGEKIRAARERLRSRNKKAKNR